MLTLLAAGGLRAADVLPPVEPATGAGSAAWIIIALPALGALVLFLGGRRTDRFGHLIGVATVVLSFVYGAVLFVGALAQPAEERVRDLPLYEWFSSGALSVEFGLRLDPLSLTFVLLITGVGSLIHIYSVAYMDHDEQPAQVLRDAQPVRRVDARARSRQRVPHPLPRVGGRRPGVVPADRVLRRPPARGERGEEGVPDEPGRRRRPRARDLHPVPAAGHHAVHRGLRPRRGDVHRHADRGDAAAPARRVRQVRSVPAAGLAPRRHGGPDPGVGAHPRGHDGHRRGLPRRADPPPLRPRADRPAGRRHRRRDHAAHRRDHRAAPTTTSRRSSPTPRSARSAT